MILIGSRSDLKPEAVSVTLLESLRSVVFDNFPLFKNADLISKVVSFVNILSGNYYSPTFAHLLNYIPNLNHRLLVKVRSRLIKNDKFRVSNKSKSER